VKRNAGPQSRFGYRSGRLRPGPDGWGARGARAGSSRRRSAETSLEKAASRMRSVRARLTAVTAAPGARRMSAARRAAAASPPTAWPRRLERGGAPRSPALFPRRWRGGCRVLAAVRLQALFPGALRPSRGGHAPVNRARTFCSEMHKACRGCPRRSYACRDRGLSYASIISPAPRSEYTPPAGSTMELRALAVLKQQSSA